MASFFASLRIRLIVLILVSVVPAAAVFYANDAVREVVRVALPAAVDHGFSLHSLYLAFTLFSIVAVAWLGSKYFVLRPLEALTGATERMAAGEEGLRTADGCEPEELRRLASALDEMARLLERKEARCIAAEAALRSATGRLDYLTSASPGAIYTRSPHGSHSLTFVSSNVVDLLGYEVKGFVADDSFWIDRVHPDDKARVLCELSALGERGRHSYEYRFLHQDGAYRWMFDDMNLVRDKEGAPLEIVGFWSDITAHKRLEEALRESEERYRSVFENSLDAILVGSPDGAIHAANPEACRLFGRTEAEICQLRRHGLVDPADPRLDRFLEERRRTGKAAGEFTHFRRDGTGFLAEVGSCLFTDRDGRERSIIIIRDITRRKQAELALIASEERFRSLSESSPLGIVQVDVDGNCVYANRRWREITGQNPDEAIGAGWTQVVHPEDHEMVLTVQRKHFAAGQEHALQFRISKPDGEVRWVRSRAAPIRTQTGELTGYVAVLTDVTHQKTMMDELVRSKKLEATGMLAGGIAHDFNNLLGIVVGNIGLAEMEPSLSGSARSALRTAQKASLKAANLAKRFVMFSTGGLPSKRRASLKELIHAASLIDLAESQVVVEYFIADDLWPVEIDEEQMREALANVIINAREAMPQGGTIAIRAQNIVVSPSDLERKSYDPLRAGPYVEICIADHGRGILPEDLDKAFDPYFSTKQRGVQKGMGMGLAISYSIIEKHGGYIFLESRVGTGTNCRIYLPACAGIPSEERAHKPEGITGPRRALVIEDDAALADMNGQMLRHLGYGEVETASSGEEAVDRFAAAHRSRAPFDLVILNHVIEGKIQGHEIARKLKAVDPSARVIVSSVLFDDPVISDFRVHGFSGVLPRPFHVKELQKLLNEVHS